MVDMALAHRDLVDPVPFEVSVVASTGEEPQLYDVTDMRRKVQDLLTQVGYGVDKHDGSLWQAVQAWRHAELIQNTELYKEGGIAAMSAYIIESLNYLTASEMLKLPFDLRSVPRTNVQFLPIEGAWFSGSLNYLGRARNPDGSPQYEATYEINAALEIAEPEFWHLISHEVVPGHIMNFALLHYLYHSGAPGYGFEHTIQIGQRVQELSKLSTAAKKNSGAPSAPAASRVTARSVKPASARHLMRRLSSVSRATSSSRSKPCNGAMRSLASTASKRW
jgi:hypothetical protein